MIQFRQGRSYSSHTRWWLLSLAVCYFFALNFGKSSIIYLAILAGPVILVLSELRSGVVLDSLCYARYVRGTREYELLLFYHLCGVLFAGWITYRGITG